MKASGIGTSAMFAWEKETSTRFFDRLSEMGSEVDECMATCKRTRRYWLRS